MATTSADSTLTTATTTATNQLTDNNQAKSPITATKNTIEETDDNQHKQKQQKFDNDAQLETVLNNNESTLSSTTGKCHLTQRSRLLDEIEKQRIENKLNQNTTTEPSNVTEMETDDNHPVVAAKAPESDAGCESMDTDESPAPLKPEKVITEECKEREAEICLSRILDAFWYDHCEGHIIVTETASTYKDLVIDENERIHFGDLAFQIIVEIIVQYFDGKQIDFKASATDQAAGKLASAISGTSSATSEPEHMETNEMNCMAPNMMPHNLPDQGALTYLMQSYIRCCNEYERYNSTKNLAKYDSVVVDVIAMVKKELITGTKLLLSGKIVKQLHKSAQSRPNHSVLLKLMYDDAVPSDFLCLLIEESYPEPKIFEAIFGTLVTNLYFDMQSRIISKNIDMAPINVLKQLVEITISNGVRPISNLVTGLTNFYPKLCTESHGREIAKVSYLGPFLSLSVFSEENPKLAEDVDDNWEVTFGNGLRMVSVLAKFLWSIDN